MTLGFKHRAKLLKKFILVGEWCVQNNNFNTAFEIASALDKVLLHPNLLARSSLVSCISLEIHLG